MANPLIDPIVPTEFKELSFMVSFPTVIPVLQRINITELFRMLGTPLTNVFLKVLVSSPLDPPRRHSEGVGEQVLYNKSILAFCFS